MRVHTLQIHALIITVFRGLSHERCRENNPQSNLDCKHRLFDFIESDVLNSNAQDSFL